jgi:uncharacterized protein
MSSIHEEIQKIRIIDNHEHIDPKEIRKKNRVDVFGLLHYLDSDLITAGMQRGILSAGSPLSDEEKASIFLEYFGRTFNTGYARVFQTAMKDLYGMDDWTVKGILDLNEKVKKATDDDRWYETVLKQKSGIDLVITLAYTTRVDFNLFRPVMFFDFTFQLRKKSELEQIEKLSGIRVHRFHDYLQAVESIMDRFVSEGMVAVKLGHGYWRTLKTTRPTFHEAEQSFNLLMSEHLDEPVSHREMTPFEDYMIHYIIQCSIRKKLPVQIHTGLQETSVSRNGNIITNSNVVDLIPLLLAYPDCRFVLLHCGIPYHQEYLTIVKNFPNVYGDFTWVYAISPTTAKQILHQMIEMVPSNKIIGFGGDFNYVEGAYAHQKWARKIVGDVLTEKVLDHYLTEAEAITFAKRIFRENLIDLYNLNI